MRTIRCTVVVVGSAIIGSESMFSPAYADSSVASVADAKAQLTKHGVKEIVFAAREDGND